MLLVETRLGGSPIHGIGLFLAEPVRKGQPIWRFDTRTDRVYSQSEFEALPDLARRFLETYATWHQVTRTWLLCGDAARHMNHSDRPNTISSEISFGEDIAACDMPAGTELTCDYRTICDAMRASPEMFARTE